MTFQEVVHKWAILCFGLEIAKDPIERSHRFLEESLELVQVLGCREDEAIALVKYVYSRQKGSIGQEVGGVMVTLGALCAAIGWDMEYCGSKELERILDPEVLDKIRQKNLTKIKRSPLPGRTT